jgi:hypothetical protein
MRRETIALGVVVGFGLLIASAVAVQAQEVPQPVFGSCCTCQAKIKLKNGPALDFLRVGARIIPVNPVNPFDLGFMFTLSNANGNLFTATLLPGQITELTNGRKWVYRNPAAKISGGLFSVIIQERDDELDGLIVDVKAYADLSGATLAEMTTEMVIGPASFIDTGDWTAVSNGWRYRFPE